MLQAVKPDMKPAIQEIRRGCGHDSASHAFQSLYIWQETMGLSVLLKEGFLAVRCRGRGKNTWFFPCGSSRSKEEFLKEHEREPDFSLCYARTEDIEFTKEHFGNDFTFEENSADSEYLYLRREQVELEGRKFSKIRNHINRIKKDHSLSVHQLDHSNYAEALSIVMQWEKKEHELGTYCTEDHIASLKLLKNWKDMEVEGVIINVDDEPYAVTAGFALSDQVFDICMAKQREYLPGLSVYAKWQLYQSLPDRFSYINAEEDLGIEGLRTMKVQMKPVGMIRMYDGKAIL